MIRKLLFIASLVVMLACMTLSANAGAIIDFGTGLAPTGGVITLLPGNNATGAGIPIGVLNISGAPMGLNQYIPTGAAVGGNASLDFDTIANTITITGGIPALDIPNGTVLLSGSFTSWEISSEGLEGFGPDAKNAELLAALGLSADTKFSFFGFSLTGEAIPGAANTFAAISTDIKNTEVPEPSSLILLGCGLIGLYGFSKKREKK